MLRFAAVLLAATVSITALAEESTPRDVQRCVAIADDVLQACAIGYVRADGDHKKDSPEYNYAVSACSAAAEWVGNACIGGELDDTYLHGPKTTCADIARLFKDSIERGCTATEGDFNAKCVNVWATKGADAVKQQCDDYEKAENSKVEL